jgi:hypothetical protein
VLQVSELVGFAAGGGVPIVTFIDHTIDGAPGSGTVTFSGHAIASSGLLVIGVHGERSGSISVSSVTVGGNTATERIEASDGSGTTTALYTVTSPGGTTADIVVTYNTTPRTAAVSVWQVVGLNSAVPTGTASAINEDPLSDSTIDIEANGVVIVAATADGGTSATPTAGYTERYDESPANGFVTGGDGIATTVETNRTVTVTIASSGGDTSMAIAAFR